MSKLCMKSNSKVSMELPFVLNPMTWIWRIVDAYWVLTHSFPKYVKLAEIAMMINVLGSIKDECCLSSLAFLKSELRAILEPHLPFVIDMYS
jgi:hypothetical protein